MSRKILPIAAVWILVSSFPGVAWATSPQRPAGHIRDNARLLSDAAVVDLEALLEHVQRERNIEILVVTINQLPGRRRNFVHVNRDAVTIESYAKQLFNEYEIGSMPANQGVLLLIARQDRQCRIQLGAGYSSRMDSVAKRIIDKRMIPEFKSGNYEQGIESGVHEIASSIAGLKATIQASRIGLWWLTLPAMFLTSGLVIGLSLIASGKRSWGWVIVGLVYIQYLRMRNWYNQPSYGSSSSSGDGWSGDYGSVGGGDSGYDGGGFSDGGGASGSW